MLGDPIFESGRFVAPDMIQALLPTEYGLLALTSKGLVLFDAESGERRCELPLDLHAYRGTIHRAGARIVVGVSEGRFATCRFDEGGMLVEARVHELGIDEEESYTSSLAASADAIHIGLSARRLVVDWEGTIVESIDGPLEGPENRVVIDADGRGAWGDDAQVIVGELTLSRAAPYDAPFAFDGTRFAAASLQYSRVTVALFDLSTKSTEPTCEVDYFGVGDVSAMSFAGDLLLLQSARCIVAFDLEHATVAWADALNGPTGAMAVVEDVVYVARGRRLSRRSLRTGQRLDRHEGPSHPIVQLVGRGSHVLARDGHRVYAIRDGEVVGEHDAWSVHSVDDRLWMLRRDGVLARVERGRVVPMAALRIGNGTATMVEVRDREAIVPDPNEREAPKLVRVTGEEIARIADERAMRAWFFGDGFFVHHSTYDESYARTQGFAVYDRAGEARWSDVIEAKDLGVLGVDEAGRGVVVRRDGDAQLLDEKGAVVGSFGEFPNYVDAPAVLFSSRFAVLLKPNGELARLPIEGGEVEVMHRFDDPPTALWADAEGQGLVAFGVREIRTIDLRDVLGAERSAKERFEIEAVVEAGEAEIADVIRRVSFRRFDPEQHLEPLRRRLASLPVGDAHHALAEKLRSRGARVLHRHAHESEVIAFALSPDGEHFATGSWVGEDYERGGSLQVWSTRTGKVLKVIDPVEGGVGWPGYGPCLQWSPDGSEIGAAINTNGIANFPAFGEGSAPRTHAYTTNGWSRPPSFTWSSSGEWFAISSWDSRSFIPACLVRTDAGNVNERTARWLAPNAPEGFEPFKDAPRTLRFSADDTTLFCTNNHGEAWAVDVASGSLRSRIAYEAPMDHSPCGRFFAHARANVTVHAATTGEEIQTELVAAKPDLVLWSPTSRLAVFAGGELHVFEPADGKLQPVAKIETQHGTGANRYDFMDAPMAAWAPDGSRLALLTGTGCVGIWTPGGEMQTLAVGDDMAGLLWRGELLVALGKNATEVFDASNGFSRLHRIDLSCKHEMLADIPSPLEVDGEDLGASFRPTPTFPIGGEWGLALSDGVVVCSAEHRDALEAELSFVVDGRYELPVSWAIRVYSSLEEAADELPFAPEIRAKLGQSSASTEDVLPLGTDATLEDVTELHWEVVNGLSAGWQTHASEALTLLATLHADRGDAELAVREARRIEQPTERLTALCEVAVRIAATHRELASELTVEAEGLLGQSGQRRRELAVLAAAKHALGLPEAPAMLAEAHDEEWLKDEANPCQRYAMLARAYLRTGREDEAWSLIEAGPTSHGMLPSFIERYIVQVARDGYLDHALRVATRCTERFESRGTSFTIIEALSDALTKAGRFEEALAFLGAQDGYSTTMYEQRVRSARTGDPRAELLEQARASTWPPMIARHMRDLTRAGAGQDTVASMLEHLLGAMREAKMSRQSLPEMVESLGEALARVDLASSSETLFAAFTDDASRLAICRGVLRGATDAFADARLDEAKQLARRAEPRQRCEHLVRLASALRELRPDEADALVDEALEAVVELRGNDRRFALSEMTGILLGEGQLASAYRTWKKQSKANRGHEVRGLLESLARAGELGAALHVMRQLPKRDDMNGLAQDLRVVAEIFVHGSVVW